MSQSWSSSAGFLPLCCIYFLIIFLLFPSNQPVQSIALSNLCGTFGHSCFGGNWGKRDLSPTSPSLPMEFDRGDETVNNPINHLLLEQMRMNIFRQRLRKLLQLE